MGVSVFFSWKPYKGSIKVQIDIYTSGLNMVVLKPIHLSSGKDFLMKNTQLYSPVVNRTPHQIPK